MQIDCSHYYINIYKKHYSMCALRERRLFENENEGDDFIIESNFEEDEDEDFFVYILMYIFDKLIINIFSIFLSISSIN